jgi:hypothetical protein
MAIAAVLNYTSAQNGNHEVVVLPDRTIRAARFFGFSWNGVWPLGGGGTKLGYKQEQQNENAHIRAFP